MYYTIIAAFFSQFTICFDCFHMMLFFAKQTNIATFFFWLSPRVPTEKKSVHATVHRQLAHLKALASGVNVFSSA